MLDDAAFTDDDLATLAGVPVAEIVAARAKKAPVAEPPKPARAPRAKPAEPAPAPAPETAEVEAPAPATVRVTVGEARVALPGARAPVRIAYRDVYGGPTAKFLWTHHRDLVEPYGA
jgi:hypothetical protein